MSTHHNIMIAAGHEGWVQCSVFLLDGCSVMTTGYDNTTLVHHYPSTDITHTLPAGRWQRIQCIVCLRFLVGTQKTARYLCNAIAVQPTGITTLLFYCNISVLSTCTEYNQDTM